MDAAAAFVDFVEEKNTRNFPVFQLTQNELELRYFLFIQFADDYGDVDRRQHRPHIVHELDRARAIKKV